MLLLVAAAFVGTGVLLPSLMFLHCEALCLLKCMNTYTVEHWHLLHVFQGFLTSFCLLRPAAPSLGSKF